MQRIPGGYVGTGPAAPSTSSAVGVWPLRLQYRYRRDNQWPEAFSTVEYLLVAGGGAGGHSAEGITGLDGGGGGAGGILTGATSLPRGSATTVTVGTGGIADIPPSNGNDSVFGQLTAIGGGAGGSATENGASGGSGGGGGQASSGTTSGGAGTSGQGSAGGGGTTESGGAGGGVGTSSSITGASATYATGGLVGTGEAAPANSGNGGRGGKILVTTSIVVSDAGETEANGTYLVDGTFNGRTRWRLGSTNYVIIWIGSPVSYWTIDIDGRALYLLNEGDTPAGPATIPEYAGGAAPAPSIGEDEQTISPLNGASGVVVIAYPNTLPELNVGAGLTFNQPTRSGYRVYRFTAGTGNVTLP